MRSLSSILFRRLSSKTSGKVSYWNQLPENTKNECMSLLFHALSKESVSQVRNNLSDSIAEIARQEVGSSKLNEIRNALFQLMANELQVISVFKIFAEVPEIFHNSSFEQITNIVKPGLESTSINVQVSALDVLVSLIESCEKNLANQLCQYMPQSINILQACLNDSALLHDTLLCLVDFCTERASCFAKIVEPLFKVVFAILESQQEDNIKESTVELALCIFEGIPLEVKKQPLAINRFLHILLHMLTEIEDDPDWSESSPTDDFENEIHNLASQALDRVSLAIGGRLILGTMFTIIGELIVSENWNYRYAALVSVSCIAEGSKKILETRLKDVLAICMPSFADPDDRVKYAACQAIGQLCSDFPGLVQEGFHKEIMQALINLFYQNVSDRVKSHAAAALINFCESCDKEILEIYLSKCIEAMVSLLSSSKLFILEQALTTIATLAESSSQYFVPYKDSIIPLLMNAMRSSTAEHQMIKCKCIEAISFISVAVGKESFNSYKSGFVQYLMDLQNSEFSASDPISAYLSAAWVRICPFIEDFGPIIEKLMPGLMQAASQEPDLALLDTDEDVSGYGEEWDFIQVRGKKMGINTSALDDKCIAIETLGSYAECLGKKFAPFAPQCLKVVVSNLKFDFHDGVRSASAEAIPILIKCLAECNGDKEALEKIADSCITEMLNSIFHEFDVEYASSCLSALNSLIDHQNGSCLTSQVCSVTSIRLTQLVEVVLKKIKQVSNDEDLEFDDVEELGLLSEITRTIHLFFKYLGQQFLPTFEQKFLKFYIDLCSHYDSLLQHFSICVYADLVEFCGQESFKHHEYFIPLVFQSLQSEDGDMRQAASYTLGVCAQQGGPQYYDICIKAIEPLFIAALSEDAKLSYNLVATDNAVSALAKILSRCTQIPNMETVLCNWILLCPIVTDEEEFSFVYSFLLEALPKVMHNFDSNLKHIAKIAYEAILLDQLDESLKRSYFELLQSISSKLTVNDKEYLQSELSDSKVKKLQMLKCWQ